MEIDSAVRDGIIKENENGSFTCQICGSSTTNRNSMSGHLKGIGHEKSSLKYIVENLGSVPNYLRSHKFADIIVFAKNGHLKTSSTGFTCTICNKEITIGVNTIIEHMNRHQAASLQDDYQDSRNLTEDILINEAIAQKQLTNLGDEFYRCNICAVPLSGRPSAKQHLEGEKHKKNLTKDARQTLEPVLNKPSIETCEDDSAIQTAINNKVLVRSGSRYHCRPCNKDLTSEQVAKDHCDSTKHKKQTRTSISAGMTALSALAIPENVYQVNSSPKGIVCLINNRFENHPKHRRAGAEIDSKRISETFENMGYKVHPCEDFSRNQMGKIPGDVRKLQQRLNTDCFICFVLSHGQAGDLFQTSDLELINYDDFRRGFIEGNLPEFKDKPKIFFSNFCRGSSREASALEADGINNVEVENDTVLLYASTQNTKASRSPTTGTLFVSSICDVLQKNIKGLELVQFHRKVQQELREKEGGTTIEMKNLGFIKDFYF